MKYTKTLTAFLLLVLGFSTLNAEEAEEPFTKFMDIHFGSGDLQFTPLFDYRFTLLDESVSLTGDISSDLRWTLSAVGVGAELSYKPIDNLRINAWGFYFEAPEGIQLTDTETRNQASTTYQAQGSFTGVNWGASVDWVFLIDPRLLPEDLTLYPYASLIYRGLYADAQATLADYKFSSGSAGDKNYFYKVIRHIPMIGGGLELTNKSGSLGIFGAEIFLSPFPSAVAREVSYLTDSASGDSAPFVFVYGGKLTYTYPLTSYLAVKAGVDILAQSAKSGEANNFFDLNLSLGVLLNTFDLVKTLQDLAE